MKPHLFGVYVYRGLSFFMYTHIKKEEMAADKWLFGRRDTKREMGTFSLSIHFRIYFLSLDSV